MKPFDISDWLWIVGDDESRAWSSGSAAYVEPPFADDIEPTRIASEQELWQVLASAYPTGLPLSQRPLEPWQFRAMLDVGGIASTVDAAIAAIPDATQRAVARARLDYSIKYHRNDPLIAMLAPVVGLTDAQVDALWATAAQLGIT